MLKRLTKVANKLDSLGLIKEADVIDKMIKKLAGPDYDLDRNIPDEEIISKSYDYFDRIKSGIGEPWLIFDSLDSMISRSDDEPLVGVRERFFPNWTNGDLMFLLNLIEPLRPKLHTEHCENCSLH